MASGATDAGLTAPELPARPGRDFVLITAHRRENHGEPMRHICQAILQLAQQHPELDFIYPVHPNPGVRQVAHALLEDIEHLVDGVDVEEPLVQLLGTHLFRRRALLVPLQLVPLGVCVPSNVAPSYSANTSLAPRLALPNVPLITGVVSITALCVKLALGELV